MSDENLAGRSLSTIDESRSISSINLRGLVLELVFEALKDEPESLVICTRVSNEWDEILSRQKQEFMFHLVVPFLLNYLSFQDLLQCRVVSSTWKRAVENLNKQVAPEPMSFPQIRTSGRLPFDGWTRFTIDRRPKQFMKHIREAYDAARDNPFPTRAVIFKNTTQPPPNLIVDVATLYPQAPEELERHGLLTHIQTSMECAIEFYEMLQILGTEIAHLEYSVARWFEGHNWGQQPMPHPWKWKYLIDMLHLVPNLVSLTFMDDISRHGRRCLVAGIPPPPLANLVDLRFSLICPGHIPNFFLTTYGDQLKHLVCSDADLFSINEATLCYRLPKLKTLRVQAGYLMLAGDLYLRTLASRVSAPRLHTLSIEVRHLYSEANTFWNLMTGLEAFGSSIEKLYVSVLPHNVRGNNSTMSWARKPCAETEKIRRIIGQCPRLNTFHITSLYSPVSTNFTWMLGKMGSLENLQILWKTCDEDNVGSPEDAVAYLLQASPTLRTINVDTLRTCTNRDDLEYRARTMRNH